MNDQENKSTDYFEKQRHEAEEVVEEHRAHAGLLADSNRFKVADIKAEVIEQIELLGQSVGAVYDGIRKKMNLELDQLVQEINRYDEHLKESGETIIKDQWRVYEAAHKRIEQKRESLKTLCAETKEHLKEELLKVESKKKQALTEFFGDDLANNRLIESEFTTRISPTKYFFWGITAAVLVSYILIEYKSYSKVLSNILFMSSTEGNYFNTLVVIAFIIIFTLLIFLTVRDFHKWRVSTKLNKRIRETDTKNSNVIDSSVLFSHYSWYRPFGGFILSMLICGLIASQRVMYSYDATLGNIINDSNNTALAKRKQELWEQLPSKSFSEFFEWEILSTFGPDFIPSLIILPGLLIFYFLAFMWIELFLNAEFVDLLNIQQRSVFSSIEDQRDDLQGQIDHTEFLASGGINHKSTKSIRDDEKSMLFFQRKGLYFTAVVDSGEEAFVNIDGLCDKQLDEHRILFDNRINSYVFDYNHKRKIIEEKILQAIELDRQYNFIYTDVLLSCYSEWLAKFQRVIDRNIAYVPDSTAVRPKLNYLDYPEPNDKSISHEGVKFFTNIFNHYKTQMSL